MTARDYWVTEMAKKRKARQTRRNRPAQSSASSRLEHAYREGVKLRRPSHGRENVLAILALGLLVAVSYFPATQAGFVWDDEVFTSAEPIRSVSGLWQIWFSPSDIPSEGHYWPIVYTSFWLEHKLWGFAPLGYHVVNILLHLVNTLLLWRLMLRLSISGAWVIAAIFAVHPLHVESVAWVIERKDLLAALFYLSAVLTYLRFLEYPRPGPYFSSLVLFVAGLLCKSIVVTLPAALVVYHWWQQGRVTSQDATRLVSFFVLGFAIVFADWLFYSAREPVSFDYSLVERVLIAAPALWFYAGKLLWPVDLAVIYPHWDLADPLGWGYVVAGVALVLLLYFARHWIGRGPLAGALFFAVTLSPVLGFIDYGYLQFSFVADRFQYLAGIGVMAVLIGGIAHGAGELSGAAQWGVRGLVLIALVVLGAMTYRQAGVYRDQVTFFRHIVSLNPQARGAHANLGNALRKQGRLEECLAISLSGIGKDPDAAKVHTNVGLVLLKQGRFGEAESYLRRALELEPRNPYFLQNMGEWLRKQDRYAEAVEYYGAALKSDARFALAHAALGDALFRLARYDEAIEPLERALALQADSSRTRSSRKLLAQARNRLATLRFEHQQYEEALALFQSLVEMDPQNASAHTNTGVVLYHLGRFEEALQSFDRALALDPSSQTARMNYEQVRKSLEK